MLLMSKLILLLFPMYVMLFSKIFLIHFTDGSIGKIRLRILLEWKRTNKFGQTKK